MGAPDYAAVLGIWLVAICSPGPDLVAILRESTVGGRPRGLSTASGVCTGNVLWLALALAGAGAVVQSSDGLLGALQVVGGLFLLWLAIGALRAAAALRATGNGHAGPGERTAAGNGPTTARAVAPRSLPRAFALGVATNLSNPKALIFFATIFTVLVPESATTADKLLLAALLIATEIVWFNGVAWFASSARAAAALARRAGAIERFSGTVFGLLGVFVLVEGLRHLG